jgi:hypothetical protein
MFWRSKRQSAREVASHREVSEKIFASLEENMRRHLPDPPAPPCPGLVLFEVDGIPVSFDPDRDETPRAWDTTGVPRPVSEGFVRSEGVPISWKRFEELRRT